MSNSAAVQAYRVVIVDDQPDFQEFIREELSQSGRFHVVGAAPDPDLALRVVQDASPDVVLMDVLMPGLNGFAVAQRIMQHDPHLLIIYLSVDNVMQYPTMQEQLGDLPFVSKKWFSDSYLQAILTHYRRIGWKPPSWTTCT